MRGGVDLRELIKGALSLDLPAWEGQKQMSVIQDEHLRKSPPAHAKQAGVMVVLEESQHSILLIERALHPGDKHKGQLSFPGGQFEPHDQDILQTALRETQEEVGLTIGQEEVIGRLSPLYIPVSNFNVFPHVTVVEAIHELRPDPSEVARTHKLPIETILKPIIARTQMKLSNGLTLNSIPYYPLLDKHVWGATAMILAELSSAIALYMDRKDQL